MQCQMLLYLVSNAFFMHVAMSYSFKPEVRAYPLVEEVLELFACVVGCEPTHLVFHVLLHDDGLAERHSCALI